MVERKHKFAHLGDCLPALVVNLTTFLCSCVQFEVKLIFFRRKKVRETRKLMQCAWMALRNEIGMQASTFVKSSFSFANADNVKTRLLQAFIWAPMFGDKKFVLTEPPGYFEPPPKKSKN